MGEQGGESPRWAWAATASALLPTIRLDSLARQLRAARGDALSADGWLRPLRAPSLREQCLTALPASQQSLRVADGASELLGDEQRQRGPLRRLAAAGGRLEDHLRPAGPCTACDRDALQAGLNVATMAPFAGLGAFHLARRPRRAGRLYGASLLGVTAAAAGYHSAAYGTRRRRWMRRLDYWSIALSATALNAALAASAEHSGGSGSWRRTALAVASLAAVPFAPFPVIAANSAAAEAAFFRRARLGRPAAKGGGPQAPARLRTAHSWHAALTTVGTAVFFLEDARPEVPFLHTLWHGLSFGSMCTFNALLDDCDRATAR